MNGIKKETSSSLDSMLSLEQLHKTIREKDNKIQQLELENRRLKANLSEKSSEFQLRIDELLQELDRHAQLVEQLKDQLSEQEQTKLALGELQAKVALTDSGFTSPESNTNSADVSDENLVRSKSPRNADDICAALSSFVEQNNPFMNKPKTSSNKESADMGDFRDSLQPVIDCITKFYGQSSDVSVEEPVAEVDKSGSKIEISSRSTTEELSKVNPTDLLTFLLDSGTASKETTVREFVQKARSINISSPRVAPEPVQREMSAEEAKIVGQLEDCLAQNIQKLGGQALNTMEIAKQAKRLMLAYNIGQRLFAKYVMNQVVKSQGSLSELLSKPRPWHKLTDKGREAFRRIFAWLSDDRAIELLCSLSPRRISLPCDKVEHPTIESMLEAFNPSSDTVPLTVATSIPIEDKPTPKLALVVHKPITPVVNHTPTQASTRTNSRWRHDDIPKEKIIDIFEAEKAKLREQETSLERAIINRSISPASSSKSTNTNSRKGYLNETLSKSPIASPMSSFNGEVSPSQVVLGRVKVEPAPILQEQFEKYPYLDTDEVVKQIKEYLSRHSISQRQFGENVLGLSQGSVSDLLARPKGWNMLTHKGREPFIRMKLFLEETKKFQKHNLTSEDTSTVNELSTSPSLSYRLDNEPQEEFVIVPSKKSQPAPIKMEPESEIAIEYESINNNLDDEETEDFSDDIDTIEIAKRTAEILKKHGISEKTFGEHFLKMSQTTVVDILNRPMAWALLSWKGREPYVKMLNFLQDKNAVDKLKDLEQRKIRQAQIKAIDAIMPTFKVKEEPIKEKIVRQPSLDCEPEPSLKRKSTASFSDMSDVPKKCPRFQRTIITDRQKEALLYVFVHDPRPTPKTIEQLALKLDLSTKTISNWFHNYRTRQKAKDIKPSDIEKPAILGQMEFGESQNVDEWMKGLTDLLAINESAGSAPTMVPTTASEILKTLTHQLSGESVEFDEPPVTKPAENNGSKLDKVISRVSRIASTKK